MTIIFIIVILFFIIVYITTEFNKEYFDNEIKEYTLNDYKNLMLNNDKKKLFKKALNKNLKRRRKDCLSTCDDRECIKLEEMHKLLKKCIKCNKNKKKTFKKSIIGGTCDDYDGKQDEKLDCYDIMNFGCINPDDIDSKKGVFPYYVLLNDNNINSSFDKKCAFCWQLNGLA
jgi:hypothetical protein